MKYWISSIPLQKPIVFFVMSKWENSGTTKHTNRQLCHKNCICSVRKRILLPSRDNLINITLLNNVLKNIRIQGLSELKIKWTWWTKKPWRNVKLRLYQHLDGMITNIYRRLGRNMEWLHFMIYCSGTTTKMLFQPLKQCKIGSISTSEKSYVKTWMYSSKSGNCLSAQMNQ